MAELGQVPYLAVGLQVEQGGESGLQEGLVRLTHRLHQLANRLQLRQLFHHPLVEFLLSFLFLLPPRRLHCLGPAHEGDDVSRVATAGMCENPYPLAAAGVNCFVASAACTVATRF